MSRNQDIAPMEQIHLGTIGSGVIVHGILDGVARTDGIALEAVYSRRETTGRALAEAYGAGKVYTDIDAFLNDEKMNVVYIASPNILHGEYVKKALLAGKHVICEKPFSPWKTQVEELMELAKAKNLMLIEAVPTTFLPNYQVLKDALAKIGRVRLVMANYSQYSSRYDILRAQNTKSSSTNVEDNQRKPVDRNKEGLELEVPNVFSPEYAGGCLMDINYYNVHLTVSLFGTPQSAAYFPNLYKNGIDTSGTLQMQYPDFQATCTGAKDTWGVNYYQIEGEDGYVSVDGGSNGLKSIRIGTREGEEIINLQDDPDRLYYEVQALTKLLLENDQAALVQRMEIARQAVEVVEQARLAAGIRFPGD